MKFRNIIINVKLQWEWCRRDMNNSDKYKTFDRLFWYWFVPLIVFIIIVLGFPYLFTLSTPIGLDFSKTGQIGDTIGGIMGPFIGIAAAFLTFFAFWVQYKANELHKNANDKNRHDIEIERFERKYYELVRLHKENVNEMEIENNALGRKAFMRIFYEFKFIYLVFQKLNKNKKLNGGITLDRHRLSNLSFILFYNGIGINSDKSVNHFIKQEELELVNNVRGFLKKVQKRYLEEIEMDPDKDFIEAVSQNDKEFEYKVYNYPFDGHSTRLGHYYRHLFQTVKFVVSQDSSLLSLEEKKEYLKTMRAQLTNHEQLLLYYNSLCEFGKPWYKNGYLTTYKMIHNLPLPLADFGVLPEEHFSKEILEFKDSGSELFEWHEI